MVLAKERAILNRTNLKITTLILIMSSYISITPVSKIITTKLTTHWSKNRDFIFWKNLIEEKIASYTADKVTSSSHAIYMEFKDFIRVWN